MAHSPTATNSPTYVHEMALLNKTVDDFIETGIVQFKDVDMGAVDSADWSVRRRYWHQHRSLLAHTHTTRGFVRRIAKELGRPVVIARENCWRSVYMNTVIIKRLKRNQPLVGTFFLAMEDRMAPVYMAQDKTNWYVKFRGDEGREMYDEWYQACRTDPVYRQALLHTRNSKR